MFQQNIEKAPKLFEFQRFTLCFLYPEPIQNRVKPSQIKTYKSIEIQLLRKIAFLPALILFYFIMLFFAPYLRPK